MPLNYEIEPATKLITITGEYATADDWKVLLGRILRDPLLTPGYGFLRDLRTAESPVDAATVVGIMEAVRRFWPLLKPVARCRAHAARLRPRRHGRARTGGRRGAAAANVYVL